MMDGDKNAKVVAQQVVLMELQQSSNQMLTTMTNMSSNLVSENLDYLRASVAEVEVLVSSITRNSHPKLIGYFETAFSKSDSDFFKDFRMCKETFYHIHELIGDLYVKQNHCRNKPLGENYVLMVTIWYLSNQCTFREISELFGLSPSFTHKCITEMINIICGLSNTIIKWPTIEESKKNELEFRKFANFPGVIGAVDGCHVKIKAPAETQADYLDRTMAHSVNLMAICDPEKKFIFVNAGFPGSAHDNRVLNCSGLPEQLKNRRHEYLPEGDYHIIGDSAFSLSRELLVPFKDYGNLSNLQKKYNSSLSKTRVVIENAFGLLKSRFRRLKFIDADESNIYKIIVAACILHNICLENSNNSFQIDDEYIPNELLNVQVEPTMEESGISYRNYITDMYM